MNRDSLASCLEDVIDPGRIHRDVALSAFTTFRIGGPADYLIEIKSVDELAAVVVAARDADLPLTVLGGGSNVVIADEGLRGVVVRPLLHAISQPDPGHVRAESGVTINGLVRWTISHGLAGLEAWAGTPGTLGGAIYGNAHFGGHDIGGLVTTVMLMTPSGEQITVARDDMGFAYDTSRLKQTREIVVWAEFAVTSSSPEALRQIARDSLAYRKQTQPLAMPSAGCIFQNPDPTHDQLPADVPASAGALVDRAGMKGHRIGGARISADHANFIVNDGEATARDVRALVEAARSAVRDRFGVELRDEVVFLGNV